MSRIKTICFMNSNKVWGGGEKFVLDHARRCLEAGYKVHVLANKGSSLAQKAAQERGVRLHTMRLGNLSFLNPFKRMALRRLLRSMGPESLALVMALPSDLKIGGPAARRAGVGRIVFRRGIAVPVRNSLLNRHLYGRVIDRLIVNSGETKRCVLANNKRLIPHDRIFLAYNGFDVEAFDALPAEPLLPRQGETLIIGCAARLTRQKGQRHLLQAVRILLDEGRDIRLVLAGEGSDLETLQALALGLEIEDKVEFLGFVEDTKRFYASLDIVALPSLWEGFGYALVEAMTMELPVVAFDTSSIPEVVKDEVTGLLADTGDTQALAQALDKLVLDPDLRKQLGRAGRRRVLDKFHSRKAFADFLKAVTSELS